MMNNSPEPSFIKKTETPQFERGFKSWSENIAKNIRGHYGLMKYDPLSPYQLAKYLNVRIIQPHEIVGLSQETIDYLTSQQGDEWSAVTVFSTINVIIINPHHSKRRIASTIMHELSHILRKHEPSKVYMNDLGITFRNHNPLHESEADWLAGTLLLPRDVLVHCYFKKLLIEEACEKYGVSESLFTYRMNMSGVQKQFKRK